MIFPFIRYIIEDRELHVLSMFDRMKDQSMTRYYTKSNDDDNMKEPIFGQRYRKSLRRT
jgi:hypothetical protein